MLLRILAFLLFLPTALLAQGGPRTILVLDGSGSMWGQIDGVNKIVIAREVMAELLATLPAEQELGLMSYGHRHKGDCSDIELMIAPGTDRAAIAAAVNGINPKGKTPLSAAVIQAAEALKYTEDAATVILVSDGIETCDMDPCEVGRRLEETGVGFTAHVIGFDVASDPAAQAQLKCLAEETGGLYRDAANADELAGALEEVVVAEPEPVEARITFQAIDGEGGPVIRDGLVWSIETTDGAQLTGDPGPEPELTLADTTGTATVIRLADEAVAEASFTVPFEGGPQTIVLTLPEFLPAATLDAPDTAPAGSTINVGWTGPDQTHDKILIVAAPGTDDPHQDFAFTSEGSPASLRIAVTPGNYVIQYVLDAGNKILATRPITVTEVEASLEAPDSAPVGSELSVGWTGPDAERDYIAIVPAGEDHRERITYAYTGNGNPARFAAPTAPGAYDLVYVLNANGTREIARRPIILMDVAATLTAPASALAGSEIEVGFTGPSNDHDLIVIAPAEKGSGYNGETGYPRNENPVHLTVPLEAGSWEIRYILGGRNGEIIARAPLEVTLPTATFEAPDTAAAGKTIAFSFTGPANDTDKIVIVRPDAPSSKREDTAHPSKGSPLSIRVPEEPGEWELRYMLGGIYGPVLARHTINATTPGATLDIPATIEAGVDLTVNFTGPGNREDRIVLVRPGEPADDRRDSVQGDKNSPVRLELPAEAGEWEVRYMLGGIYGEAIATATLTATMPQATLDVPASATAGGEISVAFTGPGFRRDRIVIARPDAPSDDREDSTQADRGTPVRLDVPDEPGDWEVRYLLGGIFGEIIARAPFSVTEE